MQETFRSVPMRLNGCDVSISQFLRRLFASVIVLNLCSFVLAADPAISVRSPDGRNVIELNVRGGVASYRVVRNGRPLIGPSRIGLELVDHDGAIGRVDTVVNDVRRSEIDEVFELPWGKTKQVTNRCARAVVRLTGAEHLEWRIEIRAYNDGVAFCYVLPRQDGLQAFKVRIESTRFDAVGEPVAMYNTLDSFTTSHESLYERTPLEKIPVGKLLDCPLLLTWPDGPAAAITEARVREFAGMYLRRESADDTSLQCRLSPHPTIDGVCVDGVTTHAGPWRVILLADVAGKLIESNLLLCLNDPPAEDFSWAKPGKTTFHWWYGDFEDDFKLAEEREVYVARHKRYIDFCADNNIAYHSVSGDGYAWYKQSKTDYGTALPDADVCIARPELGLPEILAYAHKKGVGIRLWVHWKPLSKQLDEAMSTYESWGVKGLMVDFLDRDDQEMIAFVDRMLQSAAQHKVHIQIHGSSKYSGEQRTFPNLFNREGVLNLEYSKWSNFCTPAHSVNVAFTRALAGPVDFHLGGFRSVSRKEFKPVDRAPVVMGTRCHNLALYVVYENPMPMVADSPSVYDGQPGFDFIRRVPTTWDETRFVSGVAGEYIVVARRQGSSWYLGGITNWTERKIQVPLDFLGSGDFGAELFFDGSVDESQPNKVRLTTRAVTNATKLSIALAPGGGFVAIVSPKN